MNFIHSMAISVMYFAVCNTIPPPPPTEPIVPTTPIPPTIKCGYKSCHPIKEGFVNVHIVPHTHDDVGWLKTVDQYYYGSKTNYQSAGVQYILDTVIDSLRKDESRRFIYVETAFFWKWWIKQHDKVKTRVRKLVNNGQLEFIGGGWSMNDEAVTHYQSIIDQMTWGLRKLNETFGICGQPKIGWQIDPFGHTREMANIFAQLGYDGFLFGRLDYQEKQLRWQTRTPEMVWRGSDSLGESSDIFTGILYNTYSPPPGFCFDILCDDEPLIDDKKSFEYNVDVRVYEFIEYLNNVARVYSTNNLLITMGEDFNYQDAETWFVNLDKLIYYVNQRQYNGSRYNLIYSTPSCYVKAIYDETKGRNNWPLKRDDFLPYGSDPHAYWTGYYTSRPAIKRYERLGNNFLQVCKQLYALADLGPEDGIDLNALREAMGVMQHHDAITGTEKQHVANDYARHLQRGIEECEIITSAAIRKLSNKTTATLNNNNDNNQPNLRTLNTCPLLNISQCPDTEKNEKFIVTIYNPLSRPVDKVVRLPVVGVAYSVIDPQGKNLDTQIIPIPEFIQSIPGRNSVANNELLFIAKAIPPFGWKSYVVRNVSKDYHKYQMHNPEDSPKDTTFIIDPNTGLLKSIETNGITLPINQNFYYYNGFVGNNSNFESRSSGAYIFRPYGLLKNITDKVSYKYYSGKIVVELHQTFNEFVHQIIRLNAIDNYVEFDWVVGPLPQNGTHGVELVTKYSSQLKSNSLFYTDSNGRSKLQRIRNSRPAWALNLSEPVAGNYYPVTSQISIRDEDRDTELAVLVDRAQGGTSLKDGEIELMVHRNCLHDDAFGVGEALNETAFGRGLVVRGSHYVTLGSRNANDGNSISAITKDIVQRRLLDTWVFITPKPNGDKTVNNYNMEFSGLKKALPKMVQILTLEPWTGFSFLLRLEHVFEKNEDNVLSQPVIISLADIFTPFEIISAKETTLGANQWLQDNRRLHFGTNGTIEDYKDSKFDASNMEARNLWAEENLVRKRCKRRTVINAIDDSLEVTLTPGQIRTFVIDIKKH